jgi:hypothetical protein
VGEILSNGYNILNEVNANMATRSTALTVSVIDHIISDLAQYRYHVAKIDDPISDHNLMVASMVFSSAIQRESIRDFYIKRINYNGLKEYLEETPFLMDGSSNANENYKHFELFLNNAIDRFHKIVKFRNRKQNEWATDELLRLITDRNRIHKKYKAHPLNEYLRGEFIKLRNRVTSLKLKLRRQYFADQFEKCKGNSKKTWDIINQMITRKTRKPENISIIDGDRLLDEPVSVCQAFSDFFGSVGEALSKSIPNVPYSFGGAVQPRSMYMRPVTESEIKTILKNLKLDASTGVDGIGVKLIKNIASNIGPTLCKLINLSIQGGIFPDNLKRARITPIFKSGSRKECTNYRPISVLPAISKVYEKVIYERISNYLEGNGIIHHNQHGFRKNRSTTSAVTDLITSIRSNIDKGNIVVGLFIDLRKAFDTVNHEILCDKLKNIGLCGKVHRLIQSYLSNRKHRVQIGDSYSDYTDINCSVPQGSMLGPLLFLIYINDMHNLTLNGSLTQYADDSCLFYYGNNIQTIFSRIQDDLNILKNWLDGNKLSINTSKTNYVIFKTQQRKLGDYTPPHINGDTLKHVVTIKYLGITLDENLTWKTHIENVKNKIIPMTGALYRISGFLPEQTKKQIYYSFIHSHLVYLNSVWGNANKTLIAELQIIQNKSIKTVYNLPRLTPTTELYKNTNILKLSDMYKFEACLLIYKMVNGHIKLNIAFTTCDTYHSHNTRGSANFVIGNVKTNYGRRNIEFQGMQFYNALPKNIRDIKELYQFKTALRNFCRDSSGSSAVISYQA